MKISLTILSFIPKTYPGVHLYKPALALFSCFSNQQLKILTMYLKKHQSDWSRINFLAKFFRSLQYFSFKTFFEIHAKLIIECTLNNCSYAAAGNPLIRGMLSKLYFIRKIYFIVANRRCEPRYMANFFCIRGYVVLQVEGLAFREILPKIGSGFEILI